MKHLISMKTLVILLAIVTGVLVAIYVPPLNRDADVSPVVSVPPAPETELHLEKNGRIVFDVTLHTAEEIRSLLERARALADQVPRGDDVPGIALVLHGQEIKFFARQNYEQHQELVDLARQMDHEGVIDVKICRTMMQNLGLKEQDMPGFIELVPFGPDEVKRLESQGYKVYL